MTMKKLVSATAVSVLTALASAAIAQEGTIPQKICEAGAFVAGDDVYSFEDVIIDGEDAIKLNDRGTIKAYGYLVGINRAETQIEAKVANVDECYPDIFFNVSVKSNQLIDVVLTKGSMADDDWKSIRRTMLKVDDGFTAKALVTLTGSFAPKAYGGLFFLASSVQIIDAYVKL